jgi:RHS repeat-associated protein
MNKMKSNYNEIKYRYNFLKWRFVTLKRRSNKLKQPFSFWTEDNRLQATQDDKTPAYYNYDAAGERNLKLTGKFVNMVVNGQSTQVPVLTDQILYASALVTFNDKGYTKHYFTEGQRVCSAIGGGGLIDVQNVTSVEGGIEELQHWQIAGIDQTFIRCLPNVVVNIKTNDLYKYVVQPNEQIQNPVEPHFYYLTDHLGSSSYITNDVGQITQTLAYMPYGEDMVNLVSNQPQYTTPYKFTGKEKDEETGFNYFSSRYYDSYLSIFNSIDPHFFNYPHITSYNYCANNPVMLVDPDGRDVYITGEASSQAVEQLQNQASNLTITRGEDGKLSATGQAKNKVEETLLGAINDDKVTVNITAENTNFIGYWETDNVGKIQLNSEVGGSYLGNDVVKDANGNVIGAIANQFVNPSALAALDMSVGDVKTGKYMVHEVVEAYYGGQMAYNEKSGDRPSHYNLYTKDLAKTQRYNKAHNMANSISMGGRSPIYKNQTKITLSPFGDYEKWGIRYNKQNLKVPTGKYQRTN